MKIGLVFDDSLDKSGGIQEYMTSLRSWLVSQGHEVQYLVGQTKRTDIAQVHSLARNLAVTFNGNHLSISLLSSSKKIKKLLRDERFDVLHVQMPYSPFMAGKVIRFAPAGTRIIGTYHVAPFSGLATFGARVQAWACHCSLRRFDTVVSVSRTAADFAQRTSGITSSVVPNMFDYPRFHDAKPLPQYNDTMKTIMFLGRLVERKGCGQLLQAVALLQQKFPDLAPFRVVICGAGSLQHQLQRFVTDHQLRNIEFVGRISETDKPRYLASATIAAFPSSAGESFGIVLLEAMASGRAAVLGGDNPGYRSVLGERPTQLFAATDPAALADSLYTLLTDEPFRRVAADWGKQAAKQYDAAIVGQQLVKLYQSVAQNSSKE